MRLLDRFREYLQRKNDLSAGRDPVWDAPPEQAPTQTMPAADYDPAIKAKAAAIVAQAEADARAAQASAQTEAWGEWDNPGAPPATVPARIVPEPPPMPYSAVSSAWVASIPVPDPADLSYDKDRHYREYLRHIGKATGTSTEFEDTGMWPRLALEPGDGSGVAL